MENLQLTLSVALMFFLRIGVPVLVLIVLGAIIERWQNKREAYIRQYLANSEKEQLDNYVRTGHTDTENTVSQETHSEDYEDSSDTKQVGSQRPLQQT